MATPRRLQAAPFAARVPGLRQLGDCVENRSSQGGWPRVAATIALTRAIASALYRSMPTYYDTDKSFLHLL